MLEVLREATMKDFLNKYGTDTAMNNLEPGDWVLYADGCNKRLAIVEEVEPQVIFVQGSRWAIDRNDILEVRKGPP